MALSRISSNTPDWRDVAKAVEHLECAWDQPVRIAMFRIGTGKRAKLRIQAFFVEEMRGNGVVSPSVFVSADTDAGDFGGFDAALLSLLYRLDFARSEMPIVMVPE